MKAPENVNAFESAINAIKFNRKGAASQLFGEIELDVRDKGAFLKKQKALINDSIDAFRVMLSKINMLRAVAKLLGLKEQEQTYDEVADSAADRDEPLLGIGSSIVYLGGSINASEEFTLKRLLFRTTRGKAVLQTFPIEVSDDDVLHGEQFHESIRGYIVLFEDVPSVRRAVQRVS
mmetsp:Transcript_20028/g.14518  ORF Transcript_20028/g.14518 Transcript_20028/m.14518 type:complete len:177 (+) Transcript_20028:284-814(+)